jgi:hypothetical protein
MLSFSIERHLLLWVGRKAWLQTEPRRTSNIRNSMKARLVIYLTSRSWITAVLMFRTRSTDIGKKRRRRDRILKIICSRKSHYDIKHHRDGTKVNRGTSLGWGKNKRKCQTLNRIHHAQMSQNNVRRKEETGMQNIERNRNNSGTLYPRMVVKICLTNSKPRR